MEDLVFQTVYDLQDYLFVARLEKYHLINIKTPKTADCDLFVLEGASDHYLVLSIRNNPTPIKYRRWRDQGFLSLDRCRIENILFLTEFERDKLRYLNLSRNNIQDISLLPEICRRFPNLTTIDISYNKIADMTPLFSCVLKPNGFIDIKHNDFLDKEATRQKLMKHLNKSIYV
jgi:Leucine-rich repeat (LRR) protein